MGVVGPHTHNLSTEREPDCRNYMEYRMTDPNTSGAGVGDDLEIKLVRGGDSVEPTNPAEGNAPEAKQEEEST